MLYGTKLRQTSRKNRIPDSKEKSSAGNILWYENIETIEKVMPIGKVIHCKVIKDKDYYYFSNQDIGLTVSLPKSSIALLMNSKKLDSESMDLVVVGYKYTLHDDTLMIVPRLDISSYIWWEEGYDSYQAVENTFMQENIRDIHQINKSDVVDAIITPLRIIKWSNIIYVACLWRDHNGKTIYIKTRDKGNVWTLVTIKITSIKKGQDEYNQLKWIDVRESDAYIRGTINK